MAKFSHTLRCSIQYRGHWLTNELTLHEIDTEMPITDQLYQIDNSVGMTFDYMRNRLDVQLGELMEQMDKSQ